ncbi:F-box protein CPR1-like [Rutidosis leptorrhynchoides]|uniref:F-box protein CPR1-like n=1 Tax=Rutidosis leptorrhynchoides TaxID=125765 RepID=UPI003A992335
MSKELPEDLIIDILSRVPTRSILRFKSVSKSWYSLFENPNFISKHIQNQSTISDQSFLTKYPVSTISGPTVGLILCDSSYKSIKIPIDINISNPASVSGSCNGLICLSFLPLGWVILLWNPATMVFKDLPISTIDRPQHDRPTHVMLGFGFDDVVKDYKVLRIIHYGFMSKQVEIFSLSTNSWREINPGFDDFLTPMSACRVFLNGNLHWPAFDSRGLDDARVIVCFDFHEEVFHYIMPPKFEFTGCIKDARWKVVAMKELLAVIGWLRVESMMLFEVWVMKEYGVVSSWTKYTSFEIQNRKVKPLGCGLKGEFLMEKDNGQLFVYDSDSQRVIKSLGNDQLYSFSDVFNHVGSLVPIVGGKVATKTNLSSVVRDPFFVR